MGTSERTIARSVEVVRSTAQLCPDRVAVAVPIWPLPPTRTDAALEVLLFAGNGAPSGQRRQAEPDRAEVQHVEIGREAAARTHPLSIGSVSSFAHSLIELS